MHAQALRALLQQLQVPLLAMDGDTATDADTAIADASKLQLSLEWRYNENGAAATRYASGDDFHKNLRKAENVWWDVFNDVPAMLSTNINYANHTDSTYLHFFTLQQIAVCVGVIPGYMRNEAVCAAAVRIVDAKRIQGKSATAIRAAEITWVGTSVKRKGIGKKLMLHVLDQVGDRVDAFVVKVDAKQPAGQTQEDLKKFYEGVGFRKSNRCLCDECRVVRMRRELHKMQTAEAGTEPFTHIQMVTGPAELGEVVLATDVTFEVGVRLPCDYRGHEYDVAIRTWEKGYGHRVTGSLDEIQANMCQWPSSE